MKKIGIVIISFLTLTACSKYAGNGDNHYLNSRNSAPLVVPPPLTNANISHFYDLPAQTQSATVSLAPPSPQ